MNNLVKIMKSGVKFNKENAHICNNLYHTKYGSIVPLIIAGFSLFDVCELLKLELSQSTINKLAKINQEIKLNVVKQELENKVGDLLKQKRNTESTITKLKQQFKSKKD